MIEAIIIVVIIAVIGLGGWLVWRHNHTKNAATTTSNSTNQQKQQSSGTQTADPYAGWKTYTDTGYTLASGINVKYPADWQVSVGGKAYAWTIMQIAGSQASFNARVSYLNDLTSAQQEWENCSSADACGPTPDSTKLDGSTSIVNGLDMYSTTMQDNSGVYHATVIKSNKASSSGTAFVELIYNGNDPSVLNIYKQVVASATF